MTLERRLLAKLDRSAEHWLFTGCVDSRGYGLLWDGRRRNNSRAHRIAYELWIGPIPEGCDVHHVCGVRACCRPEHLQAVPSAEHNAAHHTKERCAQGHDFTPENTRQARGQKVCRTCERAAGRRYVERNRERLNERKRERRRAASGSSR